MSNDIRAALERLVELDNSSIMEDNQWATKHENAIADAIEALAAEPVGEGPSMAAIDEVMEAKRRWYALGWQEAVAHWAARPAAPPAPEAGEGHWSEGICGDGAAILRDGVMVPIEEVVQALNRIPATPPAPLTDLAARLISESKPMDPEIAEDLTPEARWDLYEGPTAPPAPEPGEVAELVEELNQIAGSLNDDGFFHSCDQLWRAATLLQQLSAPAPVAVPVAVAERLPGEVDCLDEGWAWFFNSRVGWRQAVLPVSPGFTHWLPAHALPLPQGGEGEV